LASSILFFFTSKSWRPEDKDDNVESEKLKFAVPQFPVLQIICIPLKSLIGGIADMWERVSKPTGSPPAAWLDRHHQ